MQALLTALRDGGIRAVRSFQQAQMPDLTAPVTALGLKSAKSTAGVVYSYLGMREQEDGGLLPVYGKALEAEVSIQTYASRKLGAQACMEQVTAILHVLTEKIGAVKLDAFSVGPCEYEAQTDCFVCTILAQAEAYLYAIGNSEETEFTDFMLKGEAR